MHTLLKSILAIAVWFGAAIAYPQSPDGGRITVQFSDPSRPGTVDVNVISGSILVKGYEGKDVIVETSEASGENEGQKRSRPLPPEAAGLKRIPNFSRGLRIEEEGNVIKIGMGPPSRPGEIILQVPRRTNLLLKTIKNGDIRAEQVEGEIEVSNIEGGVTLTQVSGSVVAHALKGNVKARIVGVDPDKPMAFSSLNGDIDVSLPPDIKANVSMKSDNGEIYSDFDIKIDTRSLKPVAEDSRARDGKYRITLDQATRGSINGGGPEIHLKTFKGDIYIRKTSK